MAVLAVVTAAVQPVSSLEELRSKGSRRSWRTRMTWQHSMLKQSITSSGGKEEKEKLRRQKRTTQRKLCPYQLSCPQVAGDAILALTAVAREVAPSAVLTA